MSLRRGAKITSNIAEHLINSDTNGLTQQSQSKAFFGKISPKRCYPQGQHSLLIQVPVWSCGVYSELSHVNIESWNTHGHVPERSPFPLRIKWSRWLLFSIIDFVVARSSSSRRASHIVEMSTDFSWFLICDVSCYCLWYSRSIIVTESRVWRSLQSIFRQFRWSVLSQCNFVLLSL